MRWQQLQQRQHWLIIKLKSWVDVTHVTFSFFIVRSSYRARHVANNKPKTSLKNWIRTVSSFDDLNQFHLICQMLAKKLRKKKRKFLRCAHLLRKVGVWISKFHVAAVQRRLRNVQKRVMHVQSFCFADLNLLFLFLFFFSSYPCRRWRCCFNSLFLRSRNFATMVTWRHTSPYY